MTSSNPSPLLCIPRFDKRGHFLLHITPTSPDAPFPQNLACSVKATEGERAFAVTLDEAKILGSKSDKFVGTDADLLAIWGWVLFRHPAEEKLLANLDVDVSTIGDEGFGLRIRRIFGRVKQTLATLTVPEDGDAEIEIFEWACTVAARLEEVTAAEKVKEEEGALDELKKQLDELVKAKKEHEEMLMARFVKVLEAKKERIRELEAQLDDRRAPAREESVPASEENSEPEPAPVKPKPKPKGKGKRKASPSPPATKKTAAKKAAAPATRLTRSRKPAPPPPSDTEDSEDDRMEVDKMPSKKSAPADDVNALTASEDEDDEPRSDPKESEDDDDLPPVRKPIVWEVRRKPAQPPAAEKKEVGEAAAEDTADDTMDDEL